MFKILSLDGGGIRGAFAASFLASLEADLAAPIGSYFDLIAGTSTGGILAIALGLRLPAAQIVEFYQDYGPKIFAKSPIPSRLRQAIFGKYRSEPLRSAFEEVFKLARLGDSQSRLLIPAFDINAGKIYIFKTAHNPRFIKDHQRLMVDVALATAAAPTYFPRHELPTKVPLIDGGVWANNPVGLAAVEAVTILQANPRQVRILSVGCPTAPMNLHRTFPRFWGLKSYGLEAMFSLFIAGQSHGAIGTAKLLIGENSITRICPPVATGRDSLDDCLEVPSLIARGQTEGREQSPTVRAQFLEQQADPFVPDIGARPCCPSAARLH